MSNTSQLKPFLESTAFTESKSSSFTEATDLLFCLQLLSFGCKFATYNIFFWKSKITQKTYISSGLNLPRIKTNKWWELSQEDSGLLFQCHPFSPTNRQKLLKWQKILSFVFVLIICKASWICILYAGLSASKYHLSLRAHTVDWTLENSGWLAFLQNNKWEKLCCFSSCLHYSSLHFHGCRKMENAD